MKLFPGRRKQAPQLPRQIEDALATVRPSLAAECERVRTAQGRTAHLRPVSASPGVLCGGWKGPWVPAEDTLPECRMCRAEAVRRSEGEVA